MHVIVLLNKVEVVRPLGLVSTAYSQSRPCQIGLNHLGMSISV